MTDNQEVTFKKGDLVNVLSNYREIIVATGIYMGLDINEMYVKVLTGNGKLGILLNLLLFRDFKFGG